MALPIEKTIEPVREAHTRRFMVKVFVICLSFSNLSFLNAWADLYNREHDFYRKYAVTWQQLAAVTLDVLLLAVVLWIPVCLVAKSGNRTWIRILKWCVFAGLLLPLNILRMSSQVASIQSMPALQIAPGRILLVVFAVAGGISLLWTWEKLATPVSSTILVIRAPDAPGLRECRCGDL